MCRALRKSLTSNRPRVLPSGHGGKGCRIKGNLDEVKTGGGMSRKVSVRLLLSGVLPTTLMWQQAGSDPTVFQQSHQAGCHTKKGRHSQGSQKSHRRPYQEALSLSCVRYREAGFTLNSKAGSLCRISSRGTYGVSGLDRPNSSLLSLPILNLSKPPKPFLPSIKIHWAPTRVLGTALGPWDIMLERRPGFSPHGTTTTRE